MTTNSKDFNVTTVSGKQVPRNKCRFIQREYYEINVDCFLMSDNRWHRINNGKIAFDHESQKYVLREEVSLIEGIVGIIADGSFQYGMFSPNPSKNIVVNNMTCISQEVVKGIELFENISTGNLYTKDNFSSSMLKKGIKSRYSFDLDYSAGPKIKMFSHSHEENYAHSSEKSVSPRFANELNGTTFGFEIETSNGKIPERQLFNNGLIPLRDGSLRHDGIEPFEYTTIPLSGEKGLNTMIDICDMVSKYTEISKQCSLHLHIGGYKPSKQFVVALHRVLIRIQDELYSMFPENYRHTSENGFKQKDYCAPVKNLRLLKNSTVDQNFETLFSYYSGGNSRFVDFGYCNHPKDGDNRAKWNISERYCIANIIPLIWGKSGTVEWRVHVPTQNVHKMINWLYICNAVMSYAHRHQKEISEFSDMRNVNLEAIIKDTYSASLSNIIYSYVQWRKEYMTTMDVQGDRELVEDLSLPIPYTVVQ